MWRSWLRHLQPFECVHTLPLHVLHSHARPSRFVLPVTQAHRVLCRWMLSVVDKIRAADAKPPVLWQIVQPAATSQASQPSVEQRGQESESTPAQAPAPAPQPAPSTQRPASPTQDATQHSATAAPVVPTEAPKPRRVRSVALMSLARKPEPRRSSNSEAAGSSTAPEANDVKEAEEDEDEGEVPSPRELVSTLTTEELHEVAAVRKPPKGFVLAMGVVRRYTVVVVFENLLQPQRSHTADVAQLCLLFEETPKWGVARELLKEGDFTKRVLSLQPEVVPVRACYAGQLLCALPHRC